ncbi:MAG: hypothetical protein LBV72_06620 [Tannerella sp.]|nr:hypothetical protein [Tannerella sp.]
MAISKDNLITYGLSGLLGKQIVFRTQKGRTIISKRTKPKDRKSKAQLKQRSRFSEATLYAKGAIADKDIRKLYDAKAQKSDKLQTAFNVAVADYMRAPEIGHIDVTGYKGNTGNLIIISATDDFMVKEVKVRIESSDGAMVEEGNAIISSNGFDWEYKVQSDNGSLAGSKVIIRVFDLPGNICEEKVVC